MNKQILSFLMVVAIIFVYTAFKVWQIWPAQAYLAIGVTAALFALMLSSQFVYRSKPEIINTQWFQTLAWASSLVMGLCGTFIIISIPLDFIRYVLAIFYEQSYLWFSSNFYLAIFIVSCVITAIGITQALAGPRVKNVKLPIDNLAPAFNGLKIAQISDLHVGPTIRKKYVTDVVKHTNSTNPDFIFITGDLADAKAVSIKNYLAPLGDLKARYGVFYVTGNHEYYWDALGLIASMKNLGFNVLLNENRILEINGQKIMIAGVTDPVGGYFTPGHAPDTKKAVQSSTETQLKILLAHRPEACYEAEPLGFDLQFSGHTHAGQFFPFNFLVSLVHKYYKGLNKHGRLWLYVNPGTGYWGAANRFAIASEISLITLV